MSVQNQPNGLTLARFDVFQDFKESPEILNQFFSLMSMKAFHPGSVIIQEGALGSEMFFMLRGKVSVYKRTPSGDDYKVVDLEEKMNVVFGEGGLIDVDNRSATIKAISETECFVLGRESFEKFSKENPELALPVFKRIAKALMVRLRKTNQDFSLLYNALVSEIRGE